MLLNVSVIGGTTYHLDIPDVVVTTACVNLFVHAIRSCEGLQNFQCRQARPRLALN